MTKTSSKTLKITQVKSLIGHPKNTRATVKALGLKRIRHSVFKEDRPEIRGMIRKVQHLVRVERVEEKTAKAKPVGATLVAHRRSKRTHDARMNSRLRVSGFPKTTRQDGEENR